MTIRNRGRNVREDVERVEDDRTRIYLQPIAAPSILGWYGFFGATFIVATYLAGWYGGTNVPYYLFPFAAFFGGLAQFLAGMWSYRARDGLATAMHGMWGSFWMAYGLLYFLAAAGTVTLPIGPFMELGFWFIVLAAVTWVGAWAALAVSGALTGVLGFLAAGSTVMLIAQLTGSGVLTIIAGWLLIISAVIAWYTASALMLNGIYGRTVLPIGEVMRHREAPEISEGIGEPGVTHGQ